jgi:hypothetical protein
MFVPSLVRKSYSTFVPYYIHILVSYYTDDESEGENPPPPTQIPADEPIAHEPAPTPPLPRWVYSTREAIGDIFDDPSDQC